MKTKFLMGHSTVLNRKLIKCSEVLSPKSLHFRHVLIEPVVLGVLAGLVFVRIFRNSCGS